MKAYHVIYEGRVQGVGFRATVRHEASGFDVTGWVRNLPDGRVEMLAAGEPQEVEVFLHAIRQGVLASHILKEDRKQTEPPAGLRGFSIRP